jgi:hypothetical protein
MRIAPLRQNCLSRKSICIRRRHTSGGRGVSVRRRTPMLARDQCPRKCAWSKSNATGAFTTESRHSRGTTPPQYMQANMSLSQQQSKSSNLAKCEGDEAKLPAQPESFSEHPGGGLRSEFRIFICLSISSRDKASGTISKARSSVGGRWRSRKQSNHFSA